MIRLFIGNLGSGKTAYAVKELFNNDFNRVTYSNIITKGIPNNILINNEMIFTKVPIKTKKDGTVMYDLKINYDFWKDAVRKHKKINILLDEAHHFLNARRSSSKINVKMTEFIAMLRRIIGGMHENYGVLTLITQLDNRIDIIARDMSTKIMYFRCYYKKSCIKCGYTVIEDNEYPEPMFYCPMCRNNMKMHSHTLHVFYFANGTDFLMWRFRGVNTYYQQKIIRNISKIFGKYDTLQQENLISEY